PALLLSMRFEATPQWRALVAVATQEDGEETAKETAALVVLFLFVVPFVVSSVAPARVAGGSGHRAQHG
ncbi:MAG: hypothetical protein ACRDTT_07960, partial [Pseudonocardiaceae bacterium]